MRVPVGVAIVAAMAMGTAAWAAAPPDPAPVAPADVVGAKPPSARCRMLSIGDLPVRFQRFRPIVAGAANGQPIRVLLDTGASGSMIFRSTVQRLGLRETQLSSLARAAGAGGFTQLGTVDLQTFKLADVEVKNFKSIVGGEGRADIDMLLGEDFFSQADTEFDLRHGRVRMLKPQGCRDEDMPYWASGPYSQVALAEAYQKLLVITVGVNGSRVRAILDSGAQRSVITPEAARRAGMKVDAEAAGQSRGIGAAVTQTHYGSIGKFTVGDESIGNARILVSDLFSADTESRTGSRLNRQLDDLPEMLLGADFLAAHHVLVSRSRKAIFFTYEGGPVFFAPAAGAMPSPAPQAPPQGTASSTTPPAAPPPSQP